MTAPAYPIPRGAVTPCASQPSWFFPAKGNSTPTTEAAKHMCAGCPFNSGCADWAIVRGEAGIWAGTTDDDRKDIRKKRGIVPIPVEMPRLVVKHMPLGEVTCGSYGGISRHRALEERVCDVCRAFSNAEKRRQRARKAGELAARGDTWALRACSHCGKEMLPKSIPRHYRRCHSKPEQVAV